MKIAILMNPSTRLKRTGFSIFAPIKEPNPLVPRTGATRKRPKPSTSAKMSVPAISFLESSCSSPSAMFVEMVSAFIPNHRVSPRERAPLIMGRRNSLLRRVTERKRSARRSMSPAGVRTAIPQKLGERLTTPSIMPCPPTFMERLLPVLAGLAAVLEPLDPATGVHYALLAGVERVALGADVHGDGLARGRARLELVAAHAAHHRRRVLGMYAGLHVETSVSKGSFPIVYYLCKGREGAAWLAADALELAQKLGVRASLLELLDQELYFLRAVERVEDAADLPDPLGLGRLHQELFLARRGVLDVDGRVDPAVRQLPVEPELHVARALEFLEDDLVHPAPRLDERGRQDGQGTAVLDVACRPEELLRW